MPVGAVAIGLVPAAIGASTGCDPSLDPYGCTGDPGYVDDGYSTTWYEDDFSSDPSGSPYDTTWYEDDLSGDPFGSPYDTTWYEDDLSGDPFGSPYDTSSPDMPQYDDRVTTVPGQSPGLDVVPPEVLALVDEVGRAGEGVDDFDPGDLPIDEATVAGAARLVLGIDALAELGAFRRDPDPAINDAVRVVRQTIPADGLDAEGYRTEIRSLADDIGDLITVLESSGPVGEPLLAVEAALSDDAVRQGFDDGATALFEADDWLSAAADLLLRVGTEPPPEERQGDLPAVLALADRLAGSSPIDGPDVGQPDATPSSTTTLTETATVDPAVDASPTPDDEADGGLPWLLPVGLVGGLVVLTALARVAFGLRAGSERSTPAPAQAPTPAPDSVEQVPTGVAAGTSGDAAASSTGQISLEDMLDVSRRMTASLDEAEVATIALSEAERLVDGEGGLLAVWDGTRFRVLCHRPSPLFDLDALGDGSLRRVVETGRSVVQVTDDEPLLVEVPMAMAAIPVVAEGRVVGAILVVRVPALPFARQDLDGLEMLAPLIGSALLAAETHGSATQLADIDPLSGLNNRRRLTADLEAGADRPLAAIMIDIDHFKNFNDTNGHAAGDEALRQVAAALAGNVRPGDVVYRYGGEEFCILVSDAPIAEAARVAERVRAAVEAVDIPGGENQPAGRVTISVGVARSEAGAHDGVIEQADAALYQAKHGGRNQVVTASA